MGEGGGGSVYTNKNYKNKLKIYIADRILHTNMGLIWVGLIFSERANYLEN